jgi:hypothetical protein
MGARAEQCAGSVDAEVHGHGECDQCAAQREADPGVLVDACATDGILFGDGLAKR